MKSVTIENVKARIAELEMIASHGELSLRGEFELACLRQLLAAMDSEPELKPANLANKFYERYPLATFKSDSERAEAFGYFMAGAELQCFGEFIKYEDLCGDE